MIAEYACGEPAESNGNDRLLRKYIYGARVDEPVCMIDVADSHARLPRGLSVGQAVYYYHFDGLGSVVALSDSNGDSISKVKGSDTLTLLFFRDF